jgi:hypothetical protein
MKNLRYVMLAVLILGISGIAHAFQFSVLDPQDPNPFPVEAGVPFTVQFFNDCPHVLGGPSSGCFFAINDSDTETITSLVLTFADNGPGGTDGQTPFCVTSGPLSLFGSAQCGLDDGLYTLYLSGGKGIAPGEQFSLVEDCDQEGDCVLPEDFPIVTAIANAPEPNSIWMALSGIGSLGYFVRRRRRGTTV